MILFDRKKALNQIMGPAPSDNKDLGGDEEIHPHLHALAKEAIDHVHAKDPVGFAHAMHGIHLHYAGEHEATGDHEDVE